MSNLPKHDYIFVDESGDAGYALDPATGKLLSSSYYTLASLHICDDCFRDINRHVASFRYYTAMNSNLKLPPEKDVFRRLLEPISELAASGKNIWASVVYVDKQNYTGSYLKPGGTRPPDPTRFRNRMLRCLLEHHFSSYPLRSQHYDLVIDRIEMTKAEVDNLHAYLAGNYNVPTPTHITHAASIYVEPLQLVHHIAAGFKDVAAGQGLPESLRFVSARDVTTNQVVIFKKCLWARTGLRIIGDPPSP